MLVKINGNIPYEGFCAVEAHVFPNIKSTNPISPMAGIPEIIRYTVIMHTQAMVINPHSRNTPCIILSIALFIAFHQLYLAGTTPAPSMIDFASSDNA